MRIDPISDAISEQSQQHVAEPGIDKRTKGKRLRTCQIWHPRRRTETILNDMVEKLRPYRQQYQPTKIKRKRRRRRRGPRVLVA
jgi:hypothetical protein